MKTIAIAIIFAVCSQAGIIKTAGFPVIHSKKTAHALGRAVKHTAKIVKIVAF